MKKATAYLLITLLFISCLAGCGKDAGDAGAGNPSGQQSGGSQGAGNNDGPDDSRDQKPDDKKEEKFDKDKVSDEYLVGFDYFTGDFLEYAPTLIVKVRNDGKLEVGIEHTASDGEEVSDIHLFDLSDQQFNNIASGIDLKKLYNLDPQEDNPEDVCDGGYSYLIIYDKDGGVYKVCGGFCPRNKDFNKMRSVIFENLPEDFYSFCETYKRRWQYADNLMNFGSFTKYGVFLGYDGPLGELNDYQHIVIDAQYRDADEIRSFSGYTNYVFSYINIGSLEGFRDYYDEFEDLSLGSYENWDDEVWIDVSDERWQDFILNELAPSLIEKGIDGFFVDNCDVYYQFPDEEILEGLSAILKGLKETGLIVIINGGDAFLDTYTENGGSFFDVADGINQECVFTSIDWDNESFGMAEAEDEEYFKAYIEKYAAQGAVIYLLEYSEDPQHVHSIVDDYCYDHKFAYYISDSLELDLVP